MYFCRNRCDRQSPQITGGNLDIKVFENGTSAKGDAYVID
jgi:hypothetical protein